MPDLRKPSRARPSSMEREKHHERGIWIGSSRAIAALVTVRLEAQREYGPTFGCLRCVRAVGCNKATFVRNVQCERRRTTDGHLRSGVGGDGAGECEGGP